MRSVQSVIGRILPLVLVALLGAACERPAAKTPPVAAPASSWAPPEMCLSSGSDSLADLSRKTNNELQKLANHYYNCVDGERSHTGRVMALEELGKRGDAAAAFALAALYKYQSKPDRVRSLHWAQEAKRLGGRGQEIIDEWAKSPPR